MEVLPTFRKSEYNRKPDASATFKNLTQAMKVEIREELNSFKKGEMEIHEDSIVKTYIRQRQYLFSLSRAKPSRAKPAIEPKIYYPPPIHFGFNRILFFVRNDGNCATNSRSVVQFLFL